MARNKLYLCLLVCCIGLIEASHFRGGIFSWQPTAIQNQVNIDWRLSWRRSSGGHYCDQNTIDNGVLLSGEGALTCFSGCSGTIAQLSYYCTDFSESEDWTSGLHSTLYNAPGTSLIVRFSGCCWIGSLNYGGSSWSLTSTINLATRADTGRPNASPQSAMTPIIRLQHGCNHTVTIPVNDPDGDIIRCRWATSTYECDGVCNALPYAYLDPDSCELHYEAIYEHGWFAVALMVEDFVNASSTTPLSNIPIQFLIDVYSSTGPCNDGPTFVDPTPREGACVGIAPNETYFEQLIVQSGADEISIIAIDTVSPIGVIKSPIGMLKPRHYYVNLTWTPDLSTQYGENILCFSAEDSVGLSSSQQCITLVAGVASPKIILDTIEPAPDSVILSSNSFWRLQYDLQFLRPVQSRPTFTRFFDYDGNEVFSIDVTSSSVVSYLPDRVILFSTPESLEFVEKLEYYILMESGVARGLEFCGPESPAIWDPYFWRVRIKDTTPPVLQFTSAPEFSNDTVTIRWVYDEAANSTCTLQTPDEETTIVACDLSWTGADLEEGFHSIFITGRDTAGNIAEARIHSWIADLTAPVSTITNKPKQAQNKREITLTFVCNEPPCTFDCAVLEDGEIPVWVPCNSGQYTESGLSGVDYIFYVLARDRVDNIGDSVNFTWYIDTTLPTVSPLPDVELFCGDAFSPNTTGIPEVSDTQDPNPTLFYQDTPTDGCTLQRIWTARDEAGNEASQTQTITFTASQPPELQLPSSVLLACGDPVKDDRTAEDLVNEGLLFHPCNRSMEASYTDSTPYTYCGTSFTRAWTVVDDCGGLVHTEQTIVILEAIMPEQPINNQINVALDITIEWPPYPGAISHDVYVWAESSNKPNTPTYVTPNRRYKTATPYLPDTRYLWQVAYQLERESGDLLNATIIPSPTWIFITRTYADFAVANVDIPSSGAFSGKDVTISWTVVNVGSRGSVASYWYDDVYLTTGPDFTNPTRIARIQERQFLDPDDGYVASATVRLEQDRIGQYYVFVKTDIYGHIDEYDRGNNIGRSDGPLVVRLTPPPDLVVSAVVTPDNSFSGRNIDIQFTVENVGTGVTATLAWTDAIYWSSSNVSDSKDTLLATVAYSADGLLPNSEYTVVQTVSIPRYISGEYWVFVEVDYTNTVYEHFDDDNNKGRGATHIHVTLDPPADLAVAYFMVPRFVESTETIEITWSVQNIGFMTPYETFWRDVVTLRKTDGSYSRTITSEAYSGELGVDEEYTKSTTFKVPPELPDGLYNVTLFVDYYSQVFEHIYLENNIRVVEMEILQKLPDFVVNFANATTQLNVEEGVVSIQLEWIVENIGEGQPDDTSTWIDRVHISDTADNNDILGNVLQDFSGMPPGSSYVAKNTFDVKLYYQGDVQLTIQVDVGNDVLEENDDTENNRFSIQAFVPLRSSDMSVVLTAIKVDGEFTEFVLAGQIAQVIWTVENVGNWQTSKNSWNDAVYISNNDILDESAVMIGSLVREGILMVDESYQTSIDVTIPDGIWGEYFILVKTDNNDVLWQSGEESGKTKSHFINIGVAPYSVLEVQDVTYTTSWSTLEHQATDDSTRFLSVLWSVRNIGNSMVRPFEWHDAVVISNEKGSTDPPDASLVGTFQKSGQIMADQSYNLTKTVVIPNDIGDGEFFVYVVPDYFEDLPSSEKPPLYEDAPPLVIPAVPKPDLEVLYESGVPTEVFAGEQVDVVYRGTNIGISTSQNSWTDAIYLDPIPEYGSLEPSPAAFLVEDLIHVGALVSGESYSARVYFHIPYMFVGDYAVWIELNSLQEFDELNYENNLVKAPTTISVRQAPLSDLSVSIVGSYNQPCIQSGQPFELHFNISNVGNGDIPSIPFYASLYLSGDVDLDPFDLKFASCDLIASLKPNNTESMSVTVSLSFDLIPADYYFLLNVDSRNDIYELNEENNVAFAEMCIAEPSTSDIAVINVIPPSSPVQYPQNIEFQWKLVNNGSEIAQGYVCDTAYLSDDRNWEVMDQEIGTYCSSVYLEPFSESEALELRSSLPLLTPMDYHTIVRSRSNIRDLNLDNNIGVSAQTTAVSVDLLEIDIPNVVQLNLNEDKVYRVPDIRAEATLLFKMTSNTATDFNEIYVRYGEIVTTGTYDYTGSEFLAADQDVSIASSKKGDYYVLIRKTGTSSSSEPPDHISEITLSVKYATFEILSVSPREAAPLGLVTLGISGTLLPEETFVTLVRDDGFTIPSDDVYHFTSLEVYATFNVTNQPIASNYSLSMTDRYDLQKVATFPNALTLIVGTKGIIRFRFSYPENVMVMQIAQATLFVENIGNTDVLTPMLSLELTGQAQFELVYGSQYIDWTTGHVIYAVSDEGPGGILPPGGTSTIFFNVRPDIAESLTISLTVSELPSSDNIDHPYLNKTEMKPYKMDDAAWDPVWDNFLLAVGTTQASLSDHLSRTANMLSLIDRRIVDLLEMMQYQTRLADDFLSGSDLYYDTDLSFGNQDDDYLKAELIRYFPARISLRGFRGLFGRGWRVTYWDIKLAEATDSEVVLQMGLDTFVFLRDFNQSNRTLYESPSRGRIEMQSEGIVYTDETTTVRSFYTFHPNNHRLLFISNEYDNSTITLNYNGDRLESLSFSQGFVMTIKYNIKDLIDTISLAREDAQTKVSRYTYDATYTYLVSVENEDQTFTYTYAEDGGLASMERADGSGMSITYDESYKFLSGTTFFDDEGYITNSVTIFNDATGQVVMYTEPANDTVVYIYDESGYAGYVKEEKQLSNRFLKNYATDTKTTFIGDLMIGKEEFDSSLGIMTIEDANGDQMLLGLEPSGVVTFIEDGEGNVRNAEYDDEDKLLSYRFPDETAEEYVYDSNKQLMEFTNRAGEITSLEWDGSGNVISKTLPNGDLVHYLYDSNGYIIEASNKVGKILFTYNDDGTPSMVKYSNGRELYYQYDDKSRRIGLFDNEGYNISYIYNRRGELYEVRDNTELTTLLSAKYDTLGRVRELTHADSCSTKISYDERAKFEKTREVSCNTGGDTATILTIGYEYDQRNRIKSRNASYGVWSYGYDPASQLTYWVDPNGTETEIIYDKARNRKSVSIDGDEKYYEVNNLNQYQSFGLSEEFYHDPNGRLVAVVDKDTGAAEGFTYDGQNRLVEIATTAETCSFTYDAMGNLYQKSCGGDATTYLVDPFGIMGGDIIAEISDKGDEKIYYVHAGVHGLVSMKSGNNTYLYHFDSAGSVLAMTDLAGNVINTYEYDPFGNIFGQQEQIPNPFKYIGQWGVRRLLDFRGIYYMRARFYDSRHGRFLVVDPLGIGGKSPNIYCYANNNPVENIDPQGTIVMAVPFLVRSVLWGGAKSAYFYYITNPGASITDTVLAGIKGGIYEPLGNLGTVAKGVIGGVTGGAEYITKQLLSGKEIDYGDLLQASIVEGISNALPGANQIFGKIPYYNEAFTQWPKFHHLYEFAKTYGQNKLNKLIDCFQDAGCRNDNFGGIIELSENAWNALMDWIRAIDPNEIIGPAGYGAAKFVAKPLELSYRILFENEAVATAPAQLVHIETALDNNTNIRSVRVSDFGFGNFSKEITPSATIQDTIDMVDIFGVFVRVFAGIDLTKGILTWRLQAIDPETGQQPTDPSIGFLPPNPENGTDGQGFVTFSMKVEDRTPDLERVDAKATIIFDNNEPIDTSSIFNTVDAGFPKVEVTTVDDALSTGVLTLNLESTDIASGVNFVNVYDVTDTGRELVASGVTENTVTLDLPIGHTYKILAIGTDNVGNTVPSQDTDPGDVAEINFPEIIYKCDLLNDCSGHGDCVAENVCDCFPNWYGESCDSETPPVEPPVLAGISASGDEDSFTNLTISVRQTDNNPDAITNLTIKDVPTNAYINVGVKYGDDWHIPLESVPQLEILPSPNDDTDFVLTIVATTLRSSQAASREISVPVSVEAIADSAFIVASPVCFHSSQKNVSLNISVEVSDTDGSETLILTMLQVPDGMTISPAIDEGNGTFIISPDDLHDLVLSSVDMLQPVNISTMAETTEVSNGNTVVTFDILEVTECPRIPLPPTTEIPPTTQTKGTTITPSPTPSKPTTTTPPATTPSLSPRTTEDHLNFTTERSNTTENFPTTTVASNQTLQPSSETPVLPTANQTEPIGEPTKTSNMPTEPKSTRTPKTSQPVTTDTATTNKIPVAKELDRVLIIALSSLGGLALITIVVIAIYKIWNNGGDKYDDSFEMDNYGYQEPEDDFDPFDDQFGTTSRHNAGRGQGGINWVNSNYGFK